MPWPLNRGLSVQFVTTTRKRNRTLTCTMAVDALLLPRAVGRRDVCSSGATPSKLQECMDPNLVSVLWVLLLPCGGYKICGRPQGGAAPPGGGGHFGRGTRQRGPPHAPSNMPNLFLRHIITKNQCTLFCARTAVPALPVPHSSARAPATCCLRSRNVCG
jgi:hypothetical protein